MFKARVFDELDRMEKDIEVMCGLGNQCLALVPKENQELQEAFRIPVADVYETENSVIADFELPGVNKEDIELSIDDGRIEVKVESKAESSEEDKEIIAKKLMSRKFYGTVALPAEVAAESSEANYNNGILRIEIPKAKKQESRKRIEIR